MSVNPFIVPDVAEDVNLQNILNKTAPQNYVLRLFTNAHTPAAADVAGSYTEATFPGYASVNLAGAGWTIVEGNPTVASFALQTFTCSANFAGQTVYGYYYVGAVDGILRGAQLFDAPVTIKNNTETIKVTPTYTGQSAN